MASDKTLVDWLRHHDYRCVRLQYDKVKKRHLVTVLTTQLLELPASFYVTPEEEDRFDAQSRKHLLLPFYSDEGNDDDTEPGVAPTAT